MIRSTFYRAILFCLAGIILAACTSADSQPEGVSNITLTATPAAAQPTTEPVETATPTAPPATVLATETPVDLVANTPTPPSEPTTVPQEEAPDEIAFTVYSDEPIIRRAASIDEGISYIAPGAVVFREGQFHMLRGGFKGWPGLSEVAYFTSPDGFQWTRVQDAPVLRSQEVPFAEPGTMGHTAFITTDGTWNLYFQTFKDSGSPGFIGRASAPEPLGPWTVDEEPVIQPGEAGEWDDLRFVRPQVFETDEGYVMYYTAFQEANRTSMIGRATSTDGITWTKYNDPTTIAAPYANSDPVLKAAGDWDGNSLTRPAIAHTPEGWVMLYQGGQDYGLAFSDDGLHWEPYAGNPILTQDNAPGNGGRLFQAALVYHQDTYFLYLEMGGGSGADIYLLTHQGPLRPQTTSAGPISPADVIVETLVDDLPAATGGLTVDGEGNIYVADIGPIPARNGKTVYKITPDGIVTVFAEGEELLGASGNAFDSQGTLFQSNFSDNSISKITPDGEIIPFVKDVPGPVGIVMDADDNLFVASCRGAGVYKITPDGEATVFASGSLFSCPNGIAFDDDHNLYVANFRNGLVLKVTPAGVVSEFVEIPGRNNAHLVYAGDGIFYLTARGAHQVYQLNLAGEATLVAGTGIRGQEDGVGSEATFSLPNGIGISPAGDVLYINHVEATTSGGNFPSLVRMIRLPK